MARNRRVARRSLTVAAAKRMFAPKQKTWLNVFSPICDGVPLFEPNPECPNSFQIDLIDPAFVEAHLEDGCKVKRILGDLWIQVSAPLAEVGNPCVSNVQDWIFRAVLARLGLKRFEIAAGAPQELIFNPMIGEDIQTDAGGDDQGDFSEARFIREWQHLFHNTQTQSYGAGGSTTVWVPDIVACTVNSPNTGSPACLDGPSLSAGSGGGIGVGPLFLTGTPFGLGGHAECLPNECEDSTGCTFGVNIHDFWHLHLDLKFRRGVELRENQGLTLYGGWENLGLVGAERPEQPNLLVMGGLRALIET